jgi:hypothetical protein
MFELLGRIFRRSETPEQVKRKEEKRREKNIRQFEYLIEHCHKLKPEYIISTLEKIHEAGGIPLGEFFGSRPMATDVFSYSGGRIFNEGQAERLAQMLFWPELRQHLHDEGCRRSIVYTCKRFPTPKISYLLAQHLTYLEDRLRSDDGPGPDPFFGRTVVLQKPGTGSSPLKRGGNVRDELKMTREVVIWHHDHPTAVVVH